MTIQGIPSETLLSVLFRLSKGDLVNTALVSHRFHGLALIPLYRHVVLPRPMYPERTSPLALLLRTLLQHPARHIRTSNTRSFRIHNEISDAYGSVAFSVQLVQLLSLMPRLEFFEVRPLIDSNQDAFFNCLHHPAVFPVALGNLREFLSTDCDLRDGLSARLLTRLMALPSLRTLVVCIDYDIRPSVFEQFQSTSGITTLELVNACITHDILAAILKVPRSLTSFTYRPPRHFSFHLQELGKALQPLQESLVHLVLDFDKVDIDDNIEDDDGTIGSFREWGRLESLDVSLMLLFGRGENQYLQLHTLVPPGLRTLRVLLDDYWDSDSVIEQVLRLVQVGEFSRLGKVDVGPLPLADLELLRDACRRGNVELVG